MSQSSTIIKLNPNLSLYDGFYTPPKDEDAAIEFVNAEEDHVVGSVSALDDSSSFSPEFEAYIGDGKRLSVLKPQALEAFDFSDIDSVLELSNDFGNLARYLAEKCDTIDSIKTSKNAARAAAYRCSDITNACVVQAPPLSINLEQEKYDLVLVSDIESMTHSQRDAELLLNKLLTCMRSNAILLLTCQNPRPVSAWFGADKDLPYSGLYGLRENKLGHKVFADVLGQFGFGAVNQYCVLPSSDNPRTLLSREYLQDNPSALNHFYSSGLVGKSVANEYLLFSELAKHQDLFDVCDSHIFIACKEQQRATQFYNADFAHYSSPGRQQQWRTVTVKPKGREAVTKRLLIASEHENEAGQRVANTESGLQVVQNLADQGYQSGQSLAGLWLESLVHGDDSSEFEQLIISYHAWLIDNQGELAAALYDVLPFNLIVSDKGEYQVIDPEWEVEEACSPEFVLFRALFWFGFHNRHLLRGVGVENGLFSLQDFVEFGLKNCGYSNSDLARFIQTETQIQSVIERQFNQDAIDETLRLAIAGQAEDKLTAPQPKAQVFWYNDGEGFDIANSVTLKTTKSNEFETLEFSVAGIDTGRNTLRVDPIDCDGFFKVASVQIADQDGVEIWAIRGERNVAQACDKVNISYAESHLGSVCIALNADPQLIFSLPDSELAKNAAVIRLELSYNRSIDYTLAMEQLGHDSLLQQQFIASQRSELESLKAKYSELNDNFQFIKVNTKKQHTAIENLTRITENANQYIKEQQQALEDQQAVIDAQLEMMERTPIARAKLFWARLRGQSPVEEDAQEEPEIPALDEIPASQLEPHKLGQDNDDYAEWIEANSLTELDRQRIANEIEHMPLKPTFSIVVPVYNIDEEYLMLAVESLKKQIYPYWELCLVDDASPNYHIRPLLKRLTLSDERIVVRLNKNNQGIAGASNDGVNLTTGDYIGLLDHDDELSEDALYENAKVINQFPDVDFIYSDEDKVTMEGRRVDPFFKPDYSPDLLDSQNYICHFSVFSQKVVEKIEGFRLGYDGSQDHDIIIRAIQHADRVVHIPKVLYHWRKVPGSTAEVYDAKSYAWEAGRKAVQARLELSGEKGEVVLGPLQGTFQVKRDIVGDPKISIIIPFKDKPELLHGCLDSILAKSSYSNYEVIGVSNNSELPATHEAMKHYSEQYAHIRFIEKNTPFNFSELCNFGVEQSGGDYVLLLNNDIEIRSDEWLERLLEHAQRKEVGAVGGKLFFADGRIQHAGVVAGMHGAAGHSGLFFAPDDIGYYGSLMVTRNVAAVTGAMLMVSREKFDEVGGLDAQGLAVAYNDVDLCLKLLDAGYLNVITPFCHAVHYESASRGYEDNPEKMARLEKERDHFLQRWENLLERGDPFFNPNFDLECFDWTIKL